MTGGEIPACQPYSNHIHSFALLSSLVSDAP
jgi:hypothetical protein